MELKSQAAAIAELAKLSESRRKTLIIEGPRGSGKSYLASLYAKKLNIPDFTILEPKIDSIRSFMEQSYGLPNDLVVCIENLDTGVVGSAYALLKFIEEPVSSVYIVVTCRNLGAIPDTIVSRCVTVSLSNMTADDLKAYLQTKDEKLIAAIGKDPILWRSIKTFSDVDHLIAAGEQGISYYRELPGAISANSSVSWISWKLQKYPDGNPTDLNMVVTYLMNSNRDWYIPALSCLRKIEAGRVPAHIALAKFILDLKYQR